ncbi:hypothetical protein [Panacibacter microcysteis]|nr:hypothetical protein [Panacibacter microcysteis]
MKTVLKKITADHRVTRVSMFVVSFLMIAFIGATIYVMYQGF